jgi:hypothetical protein
VFFGCGRAGLRLVPELYDDAPSWSEAETITVGAGQTVTANAALDTGGLLGGRIVDELGRGLGCTVVTYSVGDDPIFYDADTTGPDGSYNMSGVVGPNRVAADCGPGFGVVVHPDTVTIASSTVGQSVADLVVPQLPGSISGSIMSDAGSTVFDACVAAVTPEGQFLAIAPASSGPVDQAEPRRRWVLTDLPPGPVRLGFFDCGTGTFRPEWWEDASDFADAETVVVESDEAVMGIDVRVTPKATLTAEIVDAEGDPIEGACVWIHDAAFTHMADAAFVSGGTAHTRVYPGDYVVLVTDCGGGWTTEWYENAADGATATPITVTESGAVVEMTVGRPAP